MSSRRAVMAVLVAVVALGASACAGGEAPRVDLPSDASPSASAGADGGGDAGDFEPVVPSGSAPPTVGVPTEARAELRGAGDADASVVAAWKAFVEARAESLRAHEPTPELRSAATDAVVDEIAARGGADARDGLTVGLRPLGRLESLRESGGDVRLTVCLWAPSTGFFVEATGEAAEGADPRWAETVTELERAGDTWRVTASRPTDRTCPGGTP